MLAKFKLRELVTFLTLLSVLNPYVMPFFQFGSDVQPLAGFLAALTLILIIPSIRISKFEAILILFAIFYLINFPRFVDVSLSDVDPKKYVRIFYILPIYFFGKYCRFSSLKFVKASIVVVVVFALMQILFPALFFAASSYLMRPFDDEFGVRGVSALSPEPTDLGFTMYFLFVTLMILRHSPIAEISKPQAITALQVMSVLIGIFTLSGSALFSFFLLLVLYGISRRGLTSLLFGLCILLLLRFILFFETENLVRPIQMLILFVADPVSLVGSTSLSYRVAHFLTGVGALFYSPLGLLGSGVGSSVALGPEILNWLNLSTHLQLTEHYNEMMPLSYSEGYLVSSAGALMLEGGLLGFLFLVAVLHRSYEAGRLVNEELGSVILLSFLLYFFQSFPISWPLPWFILGLLRNKNIFPCRDSLKAVRYSWKSGVE